MDAIKGRLYLVGAFALAGTSVVTGYILSAKLPSFTITAISMGIALLGLLPFYARQTLHIIRKLTRGDWLLLLLQAVFGIVLFRMFLLFGVRNTTATEAGILTGTAPAITSVMAYVFLREKLSGTTIAGIGGTVAGIVLLQAGSLQALQLLPRHMLGNALVLCAAASESTFNILSRRQQSRGVTPIDPMVQALLVSAFALCLSMIPALFEHPFAVLPMLGPREWLALLWYGLAVTALAFAFFYAGAKRCNAYTIAAFSGMMPLTSMLLSTLLLREPVAPPQWIGGALILLGMLMIGQKNRRIPC